MEHTCKLCQRSYGYGEYINLALPAGGLSAWAECLIVNHIDLRQCACDNTLAVDTDHPPYQAAVHRELGLGLVHEVTETTIKVGVRRAA